MIAPGNQRRTIVLHSENGSEIGGSDYYMGRLIDGLNPALWRVAVLVRPGYPLSQITRRAAEIDVLHLGSELPATPPSDGSLTPTTSLPKELPPHPSVRGRLWSRLPRNWRRDVGLLRDAARTRQTLLAYGTDVFHTMDGGCQPAVVGAAQAGCRVVVGYCGPPRQQKRSWYSRSLDARAAKCAHAHVVKSRFAAEAWGAQMGIAASRFDVIPNGIELAPFETLSDQALRQELGIRAGAIVVGMTGRMNPEKGALVWAEAIPRLLHHCPQVWVVGTGEGPCLSAIAAAAGRHQERLRLLGYRRDIPAITRLYDIAVVPSIVPETFGWVLLEAMAARRPIVASGIGAIPEVVRHEREALLVPPNDPLQLTRAIERLVHNPGLRRELGQSGRARAESQFTLSLMLDRTLALYDRISTRPVGCPTAPSTHSEGA